MFVYTAQIMMGDADVVGILFFARHFVLAHEAYEAFLESRGMGLRDLVRGSDFILPIIHAESDYRAPLRLGERVTIRLTVEEIRSRRFTIAYTFLNEEGKVACRVRTVHVAADRKTGRPIALPKAVVNVLKGSAPDQQAGTSGQTHLIVRNSRFPRTLPHRLSREGGNPGLADHDSSS